MKIRHALFLKNGGMKRFWPIALSVLVLLLGIRILQVLNGRLLATANTKFPPRTIEVRERRLISNSSVESWFHGWLIAIVGGLSFDYEIQLFQDGRLFSSYTKSGGSDRYHSASIETMPGEFSAVFSHCGRVRCRISEGFYPSVQWEQVFSERTRK
jgi:hypothetical protein